MPREACLADEDTLPDPPSAALLAGRAEPEPAAGARGPGWVSNLLGGACLTAALGMAAFMAGAADHDAPHKATLGTLVRVGGVAVPKGSDAGAWSERFAEDFAGGAFTLKVGARVRWTRPRSAWGASVDAARLSVLLEQALEAGSAMRRYHARHTGGSRAALDLAVPLRFDARRLLEELADKKDSFDAPPTDARANASERSLVVHQDGRLLDAHRTVDRVMEALEMGRSEVVAAVRVVRATRRLEHLTDVRMDTVLGHFETRYSASADHVDRSYNLEVAAKKVDGYVLMPGETFDFNRAVGERSEANGFRPAPVIAQGELVDGVGGGTCQVAGTLHAAAFFAGLPVDERRPHSRPSSYIFMGLDAVVSYPQLNLRFTNDLPFPVVLGFRVAGGIARAEILGQPSGRSVAFVRRIDEVVAFEERSVEDSSLPTGVRVLGQRGVPGFTVQNFRIVRSISQNQGRRSSYRDTYPPVAQIWRVGTGGDPSPGYRPPAGDAHPEYTADAYLSVRQGEGVEGQVINRRAGRTGVSGWTLAFTQPPAEG